MGFAEKKLALLRFIVDADEETTGKLIAFTQELEKAGRKFSGEEVAFLKKRMQDFFESGERGISAEESIKRLREKPKK